MLNVYECIEYIKRQLKENHSHIEILTENGITILTGYSLDNSKTLKLTLCNGTVDFETI